MTQPPRNQHPLNDRNGDDDWDDFDAIKGETDAPPRQQTPHRPAPTPRPPLPPAKYRWSDIWTAVLTRPRLETFHEILSDPRADGRRAYLWIFLTLMLSAFVTFSVIFNDPALIEALALTTPEFEDISSNFLMMTLIFAVPMTGGFGVVVFAGFVYAVQSVANYLLNNRGISVPNRMGQLAFVLAASLAPINLISSLLMILPVPFIGFVLTVYQVYLLMLGVRAVYDFESRDATISILLPVLGLLFLQFFLLGSFF